jgi:hypothetical protein
MFTNFHFELKMSFLAHIYECISITSTGSMANRKLVNLPSGMVYLGGRGGKLLSVSKQKFLELSTLRVQLPETLSAASETHGLWQFPIYI